LDAQVDEGLRECGLQAKGLAVGLNGFRVPCLAFEDDATVVSGEGTHFLVRDSLDPVRRGRLDPEKSEDDNDKETIDRAFLRTDKRCLDRHRLIPPPS
jgi:hypothetical protein